VEADRIDVLLSSTELLTAASNSLAVAELPAGAFSGSLSIKVDTLSGVPLVSGIDVLSLSVTTMVSFSRVGVSAEVSSGYNYTGS